MRMVVNKFILLNVSIIQENINVRSNDYDLLEKYALMMMPLTFMN